MQPELLDAVHQVQKLIELHWLLQVRIHMVLLCNAEGAKDLPKVLEELLPLTAPKATPTA